MEILRYFPLGDKICDCKEKQETLYHVLFECNQRNKTLQDELKQKCKEFNIKYGSRNLNDVLYPFEDTLKERESSKTLDFMHTFKKRLEILEIICGLVFIE